MIERWRDISLEPRLGPVVGVLVSFYPGHFHWRHTLPGDCGWWWWGGGVVIPTLVSPEGSLDKLMAGYQGPV